MGSIFLDTDTLGFGNDSFADLEGFHNSEKNNSKNISEKNFSEKTVQNFSPKADIFTQKSQKYEKKIVKKDFWDHSFSCVDSLRSLLFSMKPSFLVREKDNLLTRQVVISSSEDPMILLRKDDDSVLIGTGFSSLNASEKDFPAFGDIRLPFSERSRLRGWILTDENADIDRILLILEVLDFPPIFSSKNIIAKIRENANADTLQKIRFFEIFSSDALLQISSLKFVSIQNGTSKNLGFSIWDQIFVYENFSLSDRSFATENNFSLISKNFSIKNFSGKIDFENFSSGEILEFSEENISKNSMKFTFDTFYIDKNSVGTKSGYVLADRKNLSENGVVIFTLEEDEKFRTISGHIFIDSRGFVHSHEALRVHKELIKAVRMVYERSVAENPEIERSELVKIFRSEIAKYAFVLTGKEPTLMPIIMSKKHF